MHFGDGDRFFDNLEGNDVLDRSDVQLGRLSDNSHEFLLAFRNGSGGSLLKLFEGFRIGNSGRTGQVELKPKGSGDVGWVG